MIDEITKKKSLDEKDVAFISKNMEKFPDAFLIKIGLKEDAKKKK